MRKRSIFHAVLGGLLAVCLGLFASTNVEAANANCPAVISENGVSTEYDLSTCLDESSSVKIDGQDVSDGGVYSIEDGSKFEIKLSWSFPNTHKVKTSDVYSYDLSSISNPSIISIDNVLEGNVKSDIGSTIGTYKIENNKVSIIYTDADFVTGSNISGKLILAGEFDVNTTGGHEGETIDLNIPGVGTVVVNIPAKSEVSVTKMYEKASDADAYDFTITVTSKNTNTNVVIDDNMGKYLVMDKDSFKMQLNGEDYDAVQPSFRGYDYSYYGADSFSMIIPEMVNDDKLTITYRAALKDDAYVGSYDSYYRTNFVDVSSKEDPDGNSTYVPLCPQNAYISKKGVYDKESDTIKYTITVQTVGRELKLTDTMGEGQIYKAGTIKSDPELADIEKLFTEGSYTIPAGEAKTYTITYEAEITDAIKYSGSATNTATITSGENSSSKETTVELGDPLITKSVGSNVETLVKGEKPAIPWQVTVNVPELGLTNATISDTLDSGLTLDNDSFNITVDGVKVATDDENIKVVLGDNEFTITIGKIEKGKVVISYDTTFDSSYTHTYTNTAKIKVGDTEKTAEAEYDYEKVDNYIAKSYNSYRDEDWAEGKIWWYISATHNLPTDAKEIKIIDRIPDGMHYVDGSASMSYHYHYDNRDMYALNPVVEEITDDKSGETYTQLVFTLTENDILQLNNGYGYVISLATEVDDKVEAMSNSKAYTNYAKIVIDDVEYPEVGDSFTGQIDPSGILKKDYTYNENTAPDVEYEIEVNKLAVDLNSESDQLVLTDTMGSDLMFIMGSLSVVDADGNNVDFTYESATDDDGKTTLAITIPDGKHLTIKYTARVRLSVDEIFTDAGNTVELSGVGKDGSTSADKEITGKVLASTASSSSDGKLVSIYKYEYGNTQAALSGVKFQVWDCGEYTSADSFDSTCNTALKAELTTDSNGYAAAVVEYDHIYRIVETQTIDGYELGGSQYYFIYPSAANADTVYPDNVNVERKLFNLQISNSRIKEDPKEPETPDEPDEPKTPEEPGEPEEPETPDTEPAEPGKGSGELVITAPSTGMRDANIADATLCSIIALAICLVVRKITRA